MSSDDARTAIEAAVATWPDDVRARLLEAVASIAAVDQVPYDDPPSYTDDVLARARTYADALRRGEAVDDVAFLNDLPALSPDEAGKLVSDLAASGRIDELCWTLHFTQPHRYPVAVLLGVAIELPPGEARSTLARAAAVTSQVRLLRGIEEAIGDGGTDAELAEVVTLVASTRSTEATTSYHWWLYLHGAEPPGTEAEPPSPYHSREEPEAPPDDTVFRSPDEAATRKTYPRLDVAGTERPDVVVIDQPFEVTLGLQQRKDSALVASSPLAMEVGATVELEVVLLHDPTSIEVTGSPRASLTVTDLQPYPTVTLTCTAKYGEELAAERRLGLQLLRDGQVVAIAWRTIVAVDSADRVAGAVVPERRDVALLDLDPLLGDQPPDLVISICRADAGKGSFVWTAYAADPGVPVPDLPSTTTLEDDVSEFATQIRRSIEFSGGATEDYFTLAGRAVQIGRAVPAGIQESIRRVHRSLRPHHSTSRAAPHRGAGRALGAGLPRPPAEHHMGRALAVPGRARRGLALAARRAQAAAPPAPRRRDPIGCRAHRRLHRGLGMEAPRKCGRRGRRGRRPLHAAGADHRARAA